MQCTDTHTHMHTPLQARAPSYSRIYMMMHHVIRCICTKNQNGQIEQANKIKLDIVAAASTSKGRAQQNSLTYETKDEEPNVEDSLTDITALAVA